MVYAQLITLKTIYSPGSRFAGVQLAGSLASTLNEISIIEVILVPSALRVAPLSLSFALLSFSCISSGIYWRDNNEYWEKTM